MAERKEVEKMTLYAWAGWDEMGSGELGLKQGVVPAGTIPMVSISQENLDQYWNQAELLAATYGKRIFLVRFEAVEIVRETQSGAVG